MNRGKIKTDGYVGFTINIEILVNRRLIIPTPEQALSCFIACQTLTALYLPIYLVRLDARTGEIYILAGEETELLISRNGNRKFL